MVDVSVISPLPVEPNVPPAGASSTESLRDLRTRVLQAVVARTQTANMPELWSFCQPPPLVRQLTSDPSDLLHDLRQSFSEEELVRSRVARTKNGVLILNPVLGHPGTKFLLRATGDPARPYDAVSARGELSSAASPALRLTTILHEKYQTAPRHLILVPEDDDLQVCHALGFMPVPSYGLQRITGDHVRQYFPVSGTPRHERKYHLTLAAWQIARVDSAPSTEILAVLEHIAAVSDVYNREPHELMDVWRPSPSACGQFHKALRFRDVQHIGALLDHNLQSGRVRLLNAWFDLQEHAQRVDAYRADLPTMRRELCAAIHGAWGMPRKSELKERMYCLRQVARHHFVDGFLRTAQASDDPVERALLFLGGEIMDYVVSSDPLIRGGERMLEGHYPSADFEVLHEESLAARIQLVDPLIKIQRLLTSHKS